jgi:ABC-type transport system involved in cytochrome c biogenesis permease subunit
MSETAFQTSRGQAPRSPATPEVTPDEATPKRRVDHDAWSVYGILTALASLRLTVVLFALSIVLVFCGTLAQVDAGIWTVVNTYFRTAYVWIPLQIFFPHSAWHVGGGFPFPGGWLLGGLLLVNLLAAHLTRFKLSLKRSGILILHAGVIVMMLGELVTGLLAVEGNMTIVENGSSNFVEVREKTELAFTDRSDLKTDNVVVVPGSLLRKGGRISNDALPFDVEVAKGQYMVNSTAPAKVGPETANPANAGEGVRLVTTPLPEGSGVSSEAKIDLASAYVTFKDKKTDQSLGTYLVSLWLTLDDRDQQVTVDGKKYDVSLRWKRVYKPYTIHLNHFTHDKYLGTETPKDFSSEIHLVDPARGVDRDHIKISMNDPLRYGGETFYQQSFLPGDAGTVLQVVRNPGWLMPYVSCGLVALGMLIHFSLHLVGFLRKKTPGVVWVAPWGIGLLLFGGAGLFFEVVLRLISLGASGGSWVGSRTVAPPPAEAQSPLARFFPWIIVGIGALYLAGSMMPATDDGKMHLTEFGSLPVVDHGRVKPFDTLARIDLMILSNRQEWQEKDKAPDDLFPPPSRPAIEWLLDVMTSKLSRNGTAEKAPIFRIENDQVLKLLGLKPKPGSFRYAIDEFADKFAALEDEARRAHDVDPKQRDLFDEKVLELYQHLQIYVELAQWQVPLAVPPQDKGEEWKAFVDAMREAKAGGKENPAARALGTILLAYAENKPDDFNKAVDAYREQLAKQMPAEASMAGFEVFFNHFAPFYQCLILYVGVFLLASLSWIGWSRPLNRAAFCLALMTLVVHTWALTARMYIQGRPPVTNLYSSAVFIGWGAVVLALILEWIFKDGIGSVAAAVVGFVTLVIAHNLAGSGDTLEMMQAVLDTNFWLATHVTCVTSGYMATFLAGFLGLLYIGYGVATSLIGMPTSVTRDTQQRLGQMIYGVVCFAMFFSFVGTVLGGIWADQSWGRFWGWDPKENGALIIVVWNALVLHARWAGLVKSRGVAVLTIFGNIVTAWSWFGVNMLGVGLHSYGFMEGALWWLGAFVISQLVLIGVGVLPMKMWKTFAPQPKAA